MGHISECEVALKEDVKTRPICCLNDGLKNNQTVNQGFRVGLSLLYDVIAAQKRKKTEVNSCMLAMTEP